jgi:hypothetical protein
MKNSGIFFIAVLGFALVCGFQIPSTEAYSSVNGVISSNATWSRETGSWDLTGNILIDSGATVTIESGATVNLNGYYIRVNGSLIVQSGVTLNMGVSGSSVGNIQVNGVLSARGTSTNPIYFNGGIYYWDSLFVPPSTSSVTFMATSTAWNEQSGSGCIIEYAVMNRTGVTAISYIKFSHNQLNGSGISAASGSPVISDNIIQAGLSVGGGSPTIANNIIYGYIWMDSSSNIGSPVITSNYISNINPEYPYATAAGIAVLGASYSNSGQILIEKNVITGSSIGIDLIYRETQNVDKPLTIRYNTIQSNDACIQIAGKFAPTIINNNFYSNHTCIKLTPASRDFSAAQNYWGTSDSSAIPALIYDYYDDFDLGKVTYTPLLTSPDQTAPDPDQPLPKADLSGTTTNPTANPTQPNPTPSTTTKPSNPQATPTITDTSAQPQTPLGADWTTITIITLLVLVAVLLAVNILYVRRRAAKP